MNEITLLGDSTEMIGEIPLVLNFEHPSRWKINLYGGIDPDIDSPYVSTGSLLSLDFSEIPFSIVSNRISDPFDKLLSCKEMKFA